MGLIRAILKHGVSELNLNDATGTYHLGRDFVPPPVSITANLAHGTSANRLGGAELISTKAVNRNWAFSIHVSGESEAEIRNAISLLDSFIRRGTKSDPVFLHVRGSEDVGFEPLWGQFGADLRYEIVFGRATVSSSYTFGFVRREELPACGVNLDIKPFAIGLKQRVGSAIGGILEDTIGTVDGLSRGTIIPEATTNKFTNPIFGHGTFNNGWTASANLIETENTDPKFITHGKSSAKLTRKTTASSHYSQSINAGNTNTHTISFYAKKPDGSAVTVGGSNDVAVEYSGIVTTTARLIGDGWYLIEAEVTGINSSTVTGLEIRTNGVTLYVDGFQMEEKAFATPLAHGDLLGCAWTGTVHASTSTRTAARLKVPVSDSMDMGEGTARIVWKADRPHTDMGSFNMLLESTGRIFQAFWGNSNTSWNWTDDVNSAVVISQTFSAGDILIFHFVWGPGVGLKIYLAGSEIATDSTYTPPAAPTDMFIGTNPTPTEHMNGTFMDFTTFARAMTATEVLDDHANILEQVQDNRRLSPIPWLWTKDGDDIVDAFDDDDQDNYCIIGGIPGTAEAITEWLFTPSGLDGFYVGRVDVAPDNFLATPKRFYLELDGNADAGDTSNDEYDLETLGSGGIFNSLDVDGVETYKEGEKIHYFVRARSTGAAVFAAKVTYRLSGAAAFVAGEYINHTLDTSWRLYYLGHLTVTSLKGIPDDQKILQHVIQYKTISGSTVFHRDFELFIPGPLLSFSQLKSASARSVLVIDDQVIWTDPSGGLGLRQATGVDSITGDVVNVLPDRLNYVWVLLSIPLDGVHNEDKTVDLVEVVVTPRYSLL